MSGFGARPGARVLTLVMTVMLVVSACTGTAATSAPTGAPSAAPSAAPSCGAHGGSFGRTHGGPDRRADGGRHGGPDRGRHGRPDRCPHRSAVARHAGGAVAPSFPATRASSRARPAEPDRRLCRPLLRRRRQHEPDEPAAATTSGRTSILSTCSRTASSRRPSTRTRSAASTANSFPSSPSVEVSSDQLTWTFKLRKASSGMTARDFTADDVKFTFELCLESDRSGPCYPGGRLRRSSAPRPSSTERPPDLPASRRRSADRHHRPRRAERAVAVRRHGPVHRPEGLDRPDPERADREKTEYWCTPGKAVGTGPFKVTGYSAGQSMESPATTTTGGPSRSSTRSSAASSRTSRRRCSPSRRVRST